MDIAGKGDRERSDVVYPSGAGLAAGLAVEEWTGQSREDGSGGRQGGLGRES